jgi:tetratricopeptide (TPR) repeat protein/predicted aspartyl protease
MLTSLHKFGWAACLLAVLAASPVQAASKCKLGKLAEIPITMLGLRPTVTAKINGVDAQFLLDSGAWYSMISSATMAQFSLRETPAPFGLRIMGIGGSTETSIATVKLFTFAGMPIHNVEFLVGGSEMGGEVVGLLGQNFLERWDVEYDLAKGIVRIFKAEDCKHTNLAYWSPSDQAMSMVVIGYTTPRKPHASGAAYINGTKITAMFDSGAATSVLSLKAAARAGVRPDSPGVVEAGYTNGIGRGTVKSYLAPFASFKIGDNEEIKNTRLRIADIDIEEGDMLVGADFFLSHHLLISNSQHRVYFTYNGGPVFNLSQTASSAAGAAPTAAAPAVAADELPDAAAYARRGSAFAGRRDFEHAIADLTRACELNPGNAQYFYERGMAYWQTERADLAGTDFDRALELDADYLPAHISRAELRLAKKELPPAVADLDAADRIAPKQADDRFTLARLYQNADLLGRAVAQYDLWIANHPDDSKMVRALNGRCWIRALQGQDLAAALSDCNAALRRSDKTSPMAAAILDGRGLARLRLGDYDKSIADYDASLKLVPKSAWSLYGRGVAKIRKSKKTEGENDLAQAESLSPTVAEEFRHRGIVP